MAIQAINPPGTTIPGISQATLVESGRLLFLSGHVPFRADGALVGASLDAQLDQVFRNMRATLKAAGGGFGNVARLTIYIRDYSPADLATIRAVRDRYIDKSRPPASALIGVAALFDDAVRVEIDAVAVLPNGE